MPITCELTEPRVAVVPTLQAEGIVMGGCGGGNKNYSHQCGGSNDLAHFNFLS